MPIAFLLAAAGAGLMLAVTPAAADPIESKREQARAIMAETQQLDAEVERAAEAWNYANIQLGKIDADLASNAKHLSAAKKSLVVAQDRIAERLRDLYVNGQGDSTLEVILGAKSLDDIISRLDAIERVRGESAESARDLEPALARLNLTEKERVVARHLLEGRSSTEIAEIERNSPKTIRQHVSQIYAKCGVGSRSEFFRLMYAR